jgi:hypothetical protein
MIDIRRTTRKYSDGGGRVSTENGCPLGDGQEKLRVFRRANQNGGMLNHLFQGAIAASGGAVVKAN